MLRFVDSFCFRGTSVIKKLHLAAGAWPAIGAIAQMGETKH